MTSHIPVSAGLTRRRSQHLSGAESAFTRQIVNTNTAARKKLSPSNSVGILDCQKEINVSYDNDNDNNNHLFCNNLMRRLLLLFQFIVQGTFVIKT